MALANYVKFLRGTKTAYNNLPRKDNDTLYFVVEDQTSEYGKLYLGEKLIGLDVADVNGGIALKDLKDVIVNNNIANSSLLSYNSITRTWSPKPIGQAIAEADLNLLEMIGATTSQNGQSGLVPAPKKGEQNLFLRGDATWANPIESVQIQLTNIENNQLILNNSVTDLQTELLNHKQDNINSFSAISTEIFNIKDGYISKPIFQATVGDLTQLYSYDSNLTEQMTLVDDINELDQRTRWGKL